MVSIENQRADVLTLAEQRGLTVDARTVYDRSVRRIEATGTRITGSGRPSWGYARRETATARGPS